MGVFHLLHHEHQARYDKMFPYLWAYTGLLALAGLLFGLAGHEDILRGLYIIVTTEDALITDYVLVAGPGAALVNSAVVTAISICVLYLARDTLNGMTLVEMGPFGVIGAITPCTNPTETIICNTIGMLAGGNTVGFNPHPAAIKTSIFAVNMLNEASLEAGGPDAIACTVENPTLETSNIMMKHKDISLLVATGGPGVVTAVLSSGKRGIGAGAGNPPALVDETADIRKAAEDIVNGCTFDNNLPCIAEKEIVAVESVADELMHYMVSEQGCYRISKEEQDKLTGVVLTPKGLNRKCVGRSAKVLLSMIGVEVPDNIRCIVFEGEKEHPLISEELMMPILGIVKAKDFEDAVEKAVWLEHGNRHSAHIHSKNVDNITKYAKAIDTAILVKNAPSYAALGFGGEGYCTFTIASRTGEGLTSASAFTKRRRCVMSDSLCIR